MVVVKKLGSITYKEFKPEILAIASGIEPEKAFIVKSLIKIRQQKTQNCKQQKDQKHDVRSRKDEQMLQFGQRPQRSRDCTRELVDTESSRVEKKQKRS